MKKNTISFKQIKNIYAIPRGGLPLAVSLSHRLNLPIIMNETEISPQTLVVDDIFDSGATLKEVGRILTNFGAKKIAPIVIARTVGGDLV